MNHDVEGCGRRFVFKCTPLHRHKRIHGLFARFLLIDRVYDSTNIKENRSCLTLGTHLQLAGLLAVVEDLNDIQQANFGKVSLKGNDDT